ncbi:ATP-binding protein [Asanoa sp. NPDC049573]|uniref:ATP-binding protein n=1 Tax=Asanoa sp. NPDC049573 TaxID=3155396 RepID=UPI00341EB69E
MIDDQGPDHARPLAADFSAGTVSGLRKAVTAHLHAQGLLGDEIDDFVTAVNELAINAVEHGGGAGHLDLEVERTTLTCHVTDHGGAATAPRVRKPDPHVPGGRGLWLAAALTDSLDLSAHGDGLTATVTIRLPKVWPDRDPP